MNKGKFKLAISVLLILLIVSFMVTLCWGTYKVSPMEVINTLLGNGTKLQNTAILTTMSLKLFANQKAFSWYVCGNCIINSRSNSSNYNKK